MSNDGFDEFKYYIRDDSYTDQNTGISHTYVRQIVGGLEVADGNININIRNGCVLSYGSSIFMGEASKDIPRQVIWSQETYCNEVPQGTEPFVCGVSLDRIRLAASYYSAGVSRINHETPIAASHFFAIAANPENLSSSADIGSVVASREECPRPSLADCWLVSSLPGVLSPVRAQLVYIQTHAPGSRHTQLNLAWRLEVEMKYNYYEAFVSAHDPSKIISSDDWVKDAPTPREDGWPSALQAKVFGQNILGSDRYSVMELLIRLTSSTKSGSAPGSISSESPGGQYRVWKWGINDPASGNRTLEVSPYIKTASPLGWHSIPARNDPINPRDTDILVNYTTTIGNNVIAQANWAGGSDWKNNYRPEGGLELVFDFPYGANPWDDGWQKREPREYINASVAHVFYISNMFHDLLYMYGFDEPSGNFQQHNFGKKGVEGDAIIIHAQDGSGFDNAFFLALPDGQKGLCRMYPFYQSKPHRDGGLDASILIHELSHGLSYRLTGGPGIGGCVGGDQAGGMGEGWSDWIATTVRSTSTYSDYPIAAWATNRAKGYRDHIYSTNVLVNPLNYNSLHEVQNQVHAIGEIWAEILWVVSNKLIEKHGFADSLFPTSKVDFYKTSSGSDGVKQFVPRNGNTLALQLVVNAMKLQPCNPTFIQARDAIIDADDKLTGGENKCLLWAGFASRGLGIDAKKFERTVRSNINGFNVPDECK
ncbi:extracellular metalloproteinase MEP [Ceratobasidium sp. AG-Ba]|nr:extracellular metalloproteinase MEP [Ceratobasidium sp. AG-Ba]QRW02296.1 extracellular metalloproteinase MEP [Ceratobasidium sp. AG-Ba]